MATCTFCFGFGFNFCQDFLWRLAGSGPALAVAESDPMISQKWHSCDQEVICTGLGDFFHQSRAFGVIQIQLKTQLSLPRSDEAEEKMSDSHAFYFDLLKLSDVTHGILNLPWFLCRLFTHTHKGFQSGRPQPKEQPLCR